MNTYMVIGPYAGKRYLVQAENHVHAQDQVSLLYGAYPVHSVELLSKSLVAEVKRKYFDELTILPKPKRVTT